jgi:hypothetical protein
MKLSPQRRESDGSLIPGKGGLASGFGALIMGKRGKLIAFARSIVLADQSGELCHFGRRTIFTENIIGGSSVIILYTNRRVENFFRWPADGLMMN